MPKRMLQLSKWAEQDLAKIAEYTLQTWGEQQLIKYRALLEQGFATTVRDPHGPQSKDREELFQGCRSFHIGRHVMLYRVKDGTVQIARILHESMEMERHIPSEFLVQISHRRNPG